MTSLQFIDFQTHVTVHQSDPSLVMATPLSPEDIQTYQSEILADAKKDIVEIQHLICSFYRKWSTLLNRSSQKELEECSDVQWFRIAQKYSRTAH